MSILLSKQHGVNPSLGVCFWCGEENNEVILFGLLPGDKEAPRRAVASYEPCDKCKEKWAQGIVLIEMADKPQVDGQAPFAKDAVIRKYPTGRWVVVSEEGIKRTFGEKTVAHVLQHRKALVDQETWRVLFKE